MTPPPYPITVETAPRASLLLRLGANALREAGGLLEVVDHQLINGVDALLAVDALEVLSPREREVGLLIAEGMSNAEIAESLVISVRTAESHTLACCHKLGAKNRAHLAAIVARAVP